MQLLSEDTLAHYGTPGMKKGVRHWQYQDGRFTPEGKERYFGKPKESNIYNVEDISKYNKYNKEFNLWFSKNFNNVNKEIFERRKTEKIDKLTGLYLKNNKTSIEDDAYNVNPYYNTKYDGFYNNCSFCSATYIERRAGYDAIANSNKYGINTGNTKVFAESIFSKNNIKDSYYNDNYEDIKTFKESMKEAEKILNKLEEGQASIISLFNAKTFSGGHYVNAEKRDGEILIIDSQSNEIYSFENFKKKFNNWPIAGITNIDYNNLEFKNINAVNNISHNEYKEDKAMNLLSEDTLAHYGTPGMKKGVRHWQYPDGRFTPEGKERYFGNKSDDNEDENTFYKTITSKPSKEYENMEDEYIDTIINLINEQNKKLIFGNEKEIINKGKSFMGLIFKRNKTINKSIEKSLNKEIQQLMANKDKYTSQEFNTKLNELVFQKNVYNNNLKEYKKPSWWSNFSNSFKQKTSEMAAEKIGRGVVEFLLG